MFVGHKMVFFRAFSGIFSKENWGKSYNRVLGGGCEGDERGISDPAGRLSYYNSL